MAHGSTQTTASSAASLGPMDSTHIERTSGQFRQKGFFFTRIESTREGTSSVRLIDLKVLPPPTDQIDGLPCYHCEEPRAFTFKPGQWIDTYIPHLPKPGGFSFVSTPKTFRDRGIVSLAVQLTGSPPSKWLWQEDIIGKPVMIRVGGNFTFPPSSLSTPLEKIRYIQFIAGGVGINMLQHICEECILAEHAEVILHYFNRRNDHVLFLDQLFDIKHKLGSCFDGHLWITRQETAVTNQGPLSRGIFTIHSRIAPTPNQVGQPWGWWNHFSKHALEQFSAKASRSLVYICGPQGLTDRLWEMYNEAGVNYKTGHIQVEKWW